MQVLNPRKEEGRLDGVPEMDVQSEISRHSMYGILYYLPTFTIKVNQTYVNIPYMDGIGLNKIDESVGSSLPPQPDEKKMPG